MDTGQVNPWLPTHDARCAPAKSLVRIAKSCDRGEKENGMLNELGRCRVSFDCPEYWSVSAESLERQWCVCSSNSNQFAFRRSLFHVLERVRGRGDPKER